MITAIIEARGGALTPTFASLTSAAADGLVRQVMVVDVDSSAAVAELADDAGATLAGSVSAAFAEARQDWFLLLRAGTRLESGWGAAAWRHMNEYGERCGWFRLAYRGAWPRAQVEETAAALAAGRFGRLRAEHGLLAPRRQLEATAAAGTPLVLPIRLPPHRLRPIEARILAEL